MNKSWKYRTVLLVASVGLALTSVGLLFAFLSDPSRHSINVRDDSRIVLFLVVGVLMTSIGVSLFAAAINHTAVTIAPKTHRDINLGIGGGVTFQLIAFIETDPIMLGAMLLSGTLLIVWASMRYAEAKGYSKSLGALGVLGLLGLIILILMPSRQTQAVDAGSNSSISS
ncbi:hypothetical protein FYK55_18600 [Roseiconus nitratireducens]|uniref:Uncharacterized protein n=1 Tax=Roseiconus nitratireducens TaxID=2605748 RepID=A0A5M6D1N2_9BACT|nr:hypothetical protein [Roseiconus nitratireducens]KAA5540926.1 hypothetical protein FYK55_18600 [Roseiconus nitratireducens]